MLFLRHFCVLKQGPIRSLEQRVKFAGTQYATRGSSGLGFGLMGSVSLPGLGSRALAGNATSPCDGYVRAFRRYLASKGTLTPSTGSLSLSSKKSTNNVNTSFPLAPSQRRGAFFEAIA